MRKPEGSSGASSGNISSMGAKTSSEQAPTAFSSTPAHICHVKMHSKVQIAHFTGYKYEIHLLQQETRGPVEDERPSMQKHPHEQASDLPNVRLQASGIPKN